MTFSLETLDMPGGSETILRGGRHLLGAVHGLVEALY
jgi:ketol-acid reductoisomerase